MRVGCQRAELAVVNVVGAWFGEFAGRRVALNSFPQISAVDLRVDRGRVAHGHVFAVLGAYGPGVADLGEQVATHCRSASAVEYRYEADAIDRTSRQAGGSSQGEQGRGKIDVADYLVIVAPSRGDTIGPVHHQRHADTKIEE